VALATVRTGEAADDLGDRLAEAGIATLVTGSAGIRMRAPDHAPMGPLTAGTVDVGVFPEDLERATELLDDWPGRGAIIEEEDDEPPPATTSPAADTPPAASKAPQTTSPLAVVLLVAAVGAIIAAWIAWTAR